MRPTVTDGVAWSVCRPVTIVSPANMAEPLEMPFGVWTWVGPRNQVLDGMYIGATWRIRLNGPCTAAMRPYDKLL